MANKKLQDKKTPLELTEVIEQDLAPQFGIDVEAFQVMESIADKISPELWNLLYAMLLPFECDMQLEMADDLLDFVCQHVIHTTGCPSADLTLKACYTWIAEEQGFEEKEIKKVINNVFKDSLVA